MVKQISANAQAGATLDQASDHTAQTKATRDPFELNITEEPPTVEQVQTILDYVGKGGVASVIKGARDEKDALKKFRESKENFLRPVVSTCDRVPLHWFNLGLRKKKLISFIDCGLEQWQGHCWRQRERNPKASEGASLGLSIPEDEDNGKPVPVYIYPPALILV